MNAYEERKAAKIERIKARIDKKRDFASKNDLSLYGESKSGIPMGQPILVGHHSERRHRRHLERIENKVRAGYEASNQADRLEERLESIENRKAIDSDNPDATLLVQSKIDILENQRERNKTINQLVKQACKMPNSTAALAKMMCEAFPNDYKDDAATIVIASKLMTPDSLHGVGIPSWWFTNTSAEIRRLKKRLDDLKQLENGWERIEFKGGLVEQMDGRILIYFDEIPSEDFRQKLKRSPFVFKWSPSVGAWSRKHTPTTQSQYFRKQLIELFEGEYNAAK